MIQPDMNESSLAWSIPTLLDVSIDKISTQNSCIYFVFKEDLIDL